MIQSKLNLTLSTTLKTIKTKFNLNLKSDQNLKLHQKFQRKNQYLRIENNKHRYLLSVSKLTSFSLEVYSCLVSSLERFGLQSPLHDMKMMRLSLLMMEKLEAIYKVRWITLDQPLKTKLAAYSTWNLQTTLNLVSQTKNLITHGQYTRLFRQFLVLLDFLRSDTNKIRTYSV